MEAFSIELIHSDMDQLTVKLLVQGFLDAHTVSHFEEKLNQLLEEGFLKIVLDFSELDYISSAGIGALMNYTKQLRDKQGDLVIFQPTDKVFKIFDLLGFSMIFSISR